MCPDFPSVDSAIKELLGDIRDRLATIKKIVKKDVYKIVYEYEANNIKAVKYYDQAGNLLLTLTFTYDAAGNLISIERGG